MGICIFWGIITFIFLIKPNIPVKILNKKLKDKEKEKLKKQYRKYVGTVSLLIFIFYFIKCI